MLDAMDRQLSKFWRALVKEPSQVRYSDWFAKVKQPGKGIISRGDPFEVFRSLCARSRETILTAFQ